MRESPRPRAATLAVESLEVRLNLSGLSGLGAHPIIYPTAKPKAPNVFAHSTRELARAQARTAAAVQSLQLGATVLSGATSVRVDSYTATYHCQLEWLPGQTVPNIGWISGTGAYVEYTVTAPAAGVYNLTLGLASAYSGTDLKVEVNGGFSGEIQAGVTGSWTAFKPSTAVVQLAAGTNVLRFTSMNWTQYNINEITLAPAAGAASGVVAVGDAAAVPVTGYSAISNAQLEYRQPGVPNIGWMSTNGSYVDYTINVAEAGGYALNLSAAAMAQASFDVYSNGTKVATFQMPSTGSWDASTALTQTVQLPAGPQTLRFTSTNGSQYNLFSVGLVRQQGSQPAAPTVLPDATISQRSMTGFIELDVVGSSAADTIFVTQAGNTLMIVTNGHTQKVTGAFGEVAVWAGAGDDRVVIDSSVTLDVRVYGQAGNDTITNGTKGKATIVTVGGGTDAVTGNGVKTSYWVDKADAVTASAAERAFGRVHAIAAFYQPYTTTAGAAGYVTAEPDGANLVDPAAGGAGTIRLTASSLWGTGAKQEDVNQGQVNDCYFLSPLQSLARLQPDRLRELAVDLGDGTFAVQFTRNGVAQYVRVDGDLATGSWGGLYYNHLGPSGNQWAAILEKAYAFFRTGQNSYSSLNYGWMQSVYQDFGIACTSFGLTTDQNTFYTQVSTALAANRAVDVGTLSTIAAGAPLIAAHAYSVIKHGPEEH